MDEQSDQIFAMTDALAERVCKIDGTTLRSIGHIVKLLDQLPSVCSPLMAARATFALKAGVCVRRNRLLMASPDPRAHRARRQVETPLSLSYRFPGPALFPHQSPYKLK